MRVEPSQLVPGCVLLNNVIGKSNRPIIPQHTVLTEEHITLLQKFLVETVDVSATLAEGEVFKPRFVEKEEVKKKEHSSKKQNLESFEDHYKNAVDDYKKLFTKWQSNLAIDMPEVRKILIRLLERMDDISRAVYTLHHYATKEDYIFHHSVAVGILSAYLARKMGFEKGEWLQIGLAGALSDCGMARLDDAIVTKTGSLTYSDYQEIKKHPTYSYRYVEKIPTITKEVKLAVLQHHERMDGSGYPIGLSKDNIHIYARIIAVCDTYHAMTCERLYKDKQSPFNVIEKLQSDQFSKLDHQVVQTFINSLANFSIGTKVRLSTNQLGEIVFVEERYPTRPMVRVEETNEIVTLKNKTSLFISEIIGN
ncbi:HD-GYP domain, c-di-GMP phosphodiesterase class II (or its inactivated variant) [Virgibacillus subterraneus]|uniref:HD-GYP domain, c-di-GMP phosphodiesterase class II (Or its inactivated variant) n=1 Tax=Virgibacillus subterraneus TaxID=621109 RepID=A0A1H8Z1B5_9BACI|nr:HD-GYP domain-containing protein [Virgibacillus subterraneus]SEP58210.1 HD-GYP domain, c-di-GMP phosphodiesterase class II (or its inactivated variant) [Virgibacillus subterraneus]